MWLVGVYASRGVMCSMVGRRRAPRRAPCGAFEPRGVVRSVVVWWRGGVPKRRGEADLGHVILLVEIDRVKAVVRGHADLLREVDEVRDVLHLLEREPRRVDLLHGAGLDRVDELAEQGAVLERRREVTLGKRFAGDGLDPALRRCLLAGQVLQLRRLALINLGTKRHS